MTPSIELPEALDRFVHEPAQIGLALVLLFMLFIVVSMMQPDPATRTQRKELRDLARARRRGEEPQKLAA